jgi:branched-chain amino acid transport system substrate-binding protein
MSHNAIRWRKYVALAAVVAVVTACGSNSGNSAGVTGSGGSAKGPPIEIGYVAGLSGFDGSFSLPTLHGEQMAVNAINSAGGIHGRKLQLIAYDSGGDPAKAAALETQLIDDPSVIATTGPIFDAEANATDPIANRAGIPFVSFSWTNVGITYPDEFRVSMDYTLAQQEFYDILARLHVKRLAMWEDNDPTFAAADAQSIALIKKFTHLNPYIISVSETQPSYTAEIQDLYNYKPQAIFDGGQEGGEVDAPLQGLEQLGVDMSKLTVFCPNCVIPGETTVDGPSVDQGAITNSFVDYSKPGVKQLAAEDKRVYHEALSYGQVQGWDAIHLLAAALSKKGATASRSALLKAMNSLRNVPTLGGGLNYRVSFSPGKGESHDAYRTPAAYTFDQVTNTGSLGPFNPASLN